MNGQQEETITCCSTQSTYATADQAKQCQWPFQNQRLLAKTADSPPITGHTGVLPECQINDSTPGQIAS